jgi:hypothetical protein
LRDGIAPAPARPASQYAGSAQTLDALLAKIASTYETVAARQGSAALAPHAGDATGRLADRSIHRNARELAHCALSNVRSALSIPETCEAAVSLTGILFP